MRTLIYLDNSATTFPKPASVNSAVISAANSAANPGRSGHKMSMKAAENIFSARTAAADLFSVCDEAHVVFTPNCTASLNIAIKGLLRNGDHVVVSSVEPFSTTMISASGVFSITLLIVFSIVEAAL